MLNIKDVKDKNKTGEERENYANLIFLLKFTLMLVESLPMSFPFYILVLGLYLTFCNLTYTKLSYCLIYKAFPGIRKLQNNFLYNLTHSPLH